MKGTSNKKDSGLPTGGRPNKLPNKKQAYWVFLQRSLLLFATCLTVITTTLSSPTLVSNSAYAFTTYASFITKPIRPVPTDAVKTTDTISSSSRFNGVVEATGTRLHLSICGQTWDEYISRLPAQHQIVGTHEGRPLQWTLAGGDEYRNNAKDILTKWSSIGLNPVLVVAMDVETADTVCNQGFAAVHWDILKSSYSRIADAKFAVAGAIADRGYRGFFIEMDVFCRKNPVPMFLEHSQKQDLINIGHGDVNYNVNIGVFMASSRMGPFFEGVSEVLGHSLERPDYLWNARPDPLTYFDQDIYRHCLTSSLRSKFRPDDDIYFDEGSMAYYSVNDVERKNNLLEACQRWSDFESITLPHHLMNAHDPPTIYDSTYCIHPLASQAFTPFAFKLGVAKFYGWDPKPIGPGEKLLKMFAGDFEFNNCWNRTFRHEDKKLKEHKANEIVSTIIAAMVEIAMQTGRTLVLPQYIRTDDAWAVPTHTLVDIRTLGVPYRVMTREESFRLMEDGNSQQVVVEASKTFGATLKDTLEERYANAKVLAIDRFCNVRDYQLPILEARKSQLKWCLDKELQWSRAVGGWMPFCGS